MSVGSSAAAVVPSVAPGLVGPVRRAGAGDQHQRGGYDAQPETLAGTSLTNACTHAAVLPRSRPLRDGDHIKPHRSRVGKEQFACLTKLCPCCCRRRIPASPTGDIASCVVTAPARRPGPRSDVDVPAALVDAAEQPLRRRVRGRRVAALGRARRRGGAGRADALLPRQERPGRGRPEPARASPSARRCVPTCWRWSTRTTTRTSRTWSGRSSARSWHCSTRTPWPDSPG